MAQPQPFADPAGPLHRYELIDGPPGIGVQVFTHQRQLAGFPIAVFYQVEDLMRPIYLRSLLSDRHLTPARQGFAKHEDAGSARPLVFVIHPFGMVPRPGNHPGDFLQQLDGLFIHGHHRMFRVQRLGVNSQDPLHGGREIPV